MLIEVRDCDLLIVVTSSTLLLYTEICLESWALYMRKDTYMIIICVFMIMYLYTVFDWVLERRTTHLVSSQIHISTLCLAWTSTQIYWGQWSIVPWTHTKCMRGFITIICPPWSRKESKSEFVTWSQAFSKTAEKSNCCSIPTVRNKISFQIFRFYWNSNLLDWSEKAEARYIIDLYYTYGNSFCF